MAGIIPTLMQYRYNRMIVDERLREDAKQEAKKQESLYRPMTAQEFQQALQTNLRMPKSSTKKKE